MGTRRAQRVTLCRAHSSCLQAPVHHGAAALELYVARLKELPSLSDPTIIKSFRYLLQDSPQGFFLTPKFIEGLQWLGVHGYAFDATFDSVQQPFALEDAIEMIQRTREGQEEGKETRFIFGESHASSSECT